MIDPTHLRPQIEHLDDLVDIDELGRLLGGYRRGSIREFMRGKRGKHSLAVPLPYIRIGKAPLFSKRQVAWWLNRLQEQVDSQMVDVKRAMRGDS